MSTVTRGSPWREDENRLAQVMPLCHTPCGTAAKRVRLWMVLVCNLVSTRRADPVVPGVRVKAMWPDYELPKRIAIPQVARDRLLSSLPITARLANILGFMGLRRLGDLHKVTYKEVSSYPTCGHKSVDELRRLIRAVQLAARTGDTSAFESAFPSPGSDTGEASAVEPAFSPAPRKDDWLLIPPFAHEFRPADLPISKRLTSALESKGVARLGDLHGRDSAEFKGMKNCGRHTRAELAALIERINGGQFQPATTGFSPADVPDLIRLIDDAWAKLPSQSRKMLFLRLGGDAKGVWTLEEVGKRFKRTRERIRQITVLSLARIKKSAGPAMKGYLKGLATVCCESLCPLTPALLTKWLGASLDRTQLAPAFYVRLLGELESGIPAWPQGQEPLRGRGRHPESARAVREVLREAPHPLPLPEVFARTCERMGTGRPQADEFLEVLKYRGMLVIDMSTPDHALVRLRQLVLSDVVRAVLLQAKDPLTAEQILARAREAFGSESVRWRPITVENSVRSEKGLYQVGARRYGLRQHFRLPHKLWPSVRRDAHRFLQRENRTISMAYLLGALQSDWTAITNKYELACVLREDDRFVDLGRLWFGLAAWGIEERGRIRDLIARILEDTGRPMTTREVVKKLQCLRSVTSSGVSDQLQRHPLVRRHGFGFYGLHSWGTSAAKYLVTNPDLIEKVIRRSEPPLTFGRLCEVLGVPTTGRLADKLWHTSFSIASVARSSDEQEPTTRLIHKSRSLPRNARAPLLEEPGKAASDRRAGLPQEQSGGTPVLSYGEGGGRQQGAGLPEERSGLT